jgi:hypothetical protein
MVSPSQKLANDHAVADNQTFLAFVVERYYAVA